MNRVTFIIKTFERPEHLNLLLGSIKKYYPGIKLLIADDSKKPLKIAHLQMPYDSGLAAGRNHLLKHVKTPYFLLLDDDFVFTEETRIEKLLELIKDYDIIGGKVEGLVFTGSLELKNGILSYLNTDKIDIIPNFFLGRTEAVKTVGWDSDLKLAEHTDFFLRARDKLKIGFCDDVVIKNLGGGSKEYVEMRKRGELYTMKFMRKWGIKKIINFNGDSYSYEGSSGDISV